jgi:hypothetical protein
MERPTGPPRLYLASSATEESPVSNSDEALHSVLAALEECRVVLTEGGNRDTALLVSVAILELQMKLNRIADSELKALCDAMLPDDGPAESSQNLKLLQERCTLLKLVK